MTVSYIDQYPFVENKLKKHRIEETFSPGSDLLRRMTQFCWIELRVTIMAMVSCGWWQDVWAMPGLLR